MRQQIATVTGNSSGQALASNVLATDPYVSPFNLGFGVVVNGTTTTVSFYIQHSFDNTGSLIQNWFYHPLTPNGTPYTTTGASQFDGNYAFPVSAIRILANGTNLATVTMTAIQAGN